MQCNNIYFLLRAFWRMTLRRRYYNDDDYYTRTLFFQRNVQSIVEMFMMLLVQQVERLLCNGRIGINDAGMEFGFWMMCHLRR